MHDVSVCDRRHLPRSLALLCAAWLFVPVSAPTAGVTVITHGFNSNVNGWVTGMAGQIASHPGFPGTNSTTYTVTLTTDGSSYYYQWTRAAGPAPMGTDSGEIIVKLDWSQMAGGSAPYNISTYNVALVAGWVLLQTNAISDLGGHALAEFPLHLIGHSRGGSLVNEISRDLGTNGVWVDQLTTLDPHPLNNDGNADLLGGSVVDASAKNTFVNVLFHDNYWQKNNSLFGIDPSGESVSGAYNEQLQNLPGGYQNTGSASPNHSNMHLWYHGPIQLVTPASDTEASIAANERTNWWMAYEARGTNAGLYYSLLGGGDRTSLDSPRGLPGNPVLRDGYNQNWDLGGGTTTNRTALPVNNGTWPNLIKLNLTGTNAVRPGGSVGVSLYYQYGGSSNLTAQFFFDRDFNPWNSNSVAVRAEQPPATGINAVNHYPNLGLATTNLAPGGYSVYAKLSDGLHTRYLYAPELLTIVASLPPPGLAIAPLAAAQFRLSVSDVAGQTLVLQTSTDLRNWQPLATNTLTTGNWLYTNTVSSGAGGRFYRAVRAP